MLDDGYLYYSRYLCIVWLDVVALGIGIDPSKGTVGIYFGPILILIGNSIYEEDE